jgi:hypothetical protein
LEKLKPFGLLQKKQKIVRRIVMKRTMTPLPKRGQSAVLQTPGCMSGALT